MNFFSRAQRAGFVIPDLATQNKFFPGTACRFLDGKLLSEQFVVQAKQLGSHKKQPCLAVILVGDNPASQIYVNNKIKIFKAAGFASQNFILRDADITEENILRIIAQLNADSNVSGILVQLPLPAGIDTNKILNAVHPKKDVDGFLAANIGDLALGNFSQSLACTPFGIMVLLAAYNIPLQGQHAVVVGRSNIVGKPMGMLLLGADATVTFAHSKTKNLAALTQQADILVVAAGREHLVTPECVKPGAVVVDVGMHRNAAGKLCGDVHPDVVHKAAALTPVPGGVGPMTIAMLLINTALSAWE